MNEDARPCLARRGDPMTEAAVQPHDFDLKTFRHGFAGRILLGDANGNDQARRMWNA